MAVREPVVPGDADTKAAAAQSGRLLPDILRFDVLPPVFSPQVVLDEPRPIPASVSDPVSWVRSFVLHSSGT